MTLHGALAAWQALRGWRRYAAALLLGVLLAAAQAPLSLWPLAFLAFILLLHLDDGGRDMAARRRSFFTLFTFCYGYFVAGHYWIGISFFVDAAKYALLLPLPMLGLPIVLAVFPATGAWLAWLIARGHRLAYMLLMPFGWLVGEWLRGHVGTGFSWNLIGYVWGDWPAAMQLAGYMGAQGLGLLTMLAASGLAIALVPGRRIALMLPALLALAMGLASLRMPADIAMLPDVHLRLVQPSIEQTLKWQDDLRQQHLQQHVALSLQSPKTNPEKPLTHVIWPETAIPYLLDEEPGLRDALAQRLAPGTVLITGAPRREQLSANPRDIAVYNSVFALGSDAQIAARYDKVHLVPFGEYLPFRSLLKPLGLDAVAAGAVDFSAGRDATPIAIPGLPFARVLICYEAIFPDESMQQFDDGKPAAGLLLNLTNDAWFGRSSGPYQHFAAARFRAVEQGLPLVRAANNGISAIVDPYGRVTVRLGLDEVGVVDGGLPAATAERPPYARIGDAPLLAFAIVILVAAFVALLRTAKH
ncbi:apolipoprotein N-acyltransferase [Ferrovibrio terrae]|uniref:Apolipoprotein N-acyltransferase n=1 Tax=Ferrovibrio terrae TaxID=2594003 RepID=A0A516H0W9_9PROT|nr:apolipoprotein N-acyltransferase [Ferrovibrio terrae]QDO97230.1 apolipoprotein N-acyltransferase [Ferrovibrio terrae]